MSNKERRPAPIANPFAVGPQSEVDEQPPVSTGTTYSLSDEEVEQLQQQAKAGSVDAMLQLMKFYRFAVKDQSKYMWWLIKAAEANDSVSQYNYAFALMKLGNYNDAISWAVRAFENGNELAKELIEEIRKRGA